MSKLANGGHGTCCAGIAAGRGFTDNKGIRGVAPLASLVGYRLLSHSFKNGKPLPARLRGGANVNALTLHNDIIAIYSNSRALPPFEKLEQRIDDTLKNGVLQGRNRLGSIFVFGGGNGRIESFDSNDSAYPSSRYVIAVAASSKDGLYAAYSSPGANILVNAPCNGIPTTDRMGKEGYNPWGYSHYEHQPSVGEYTDQDYTKFFAGTSAAIPVVAGVVALMIQANPGLDWRDVQQILIKTADKNPDPDEHWTDQQHLNVAGYSHSYNYGFGRVNAKKAVEAALEWTEDTVPDERERPVEGKNIQKQSIPEDDTGITVPIEIKENVKIEFIELYVDIKHELFCDLEIILTSPHGTQSILSAGDGCFYGKPAFNGFENWRFGSVRQFGENSVGKDNWILTIKDKNADGITGTFKKAILKIYGTELLPTLPYVQQVTAAVNGQPVYAAQWVEETVDEQTQLLFHMETPPEPVEPGAEVALTVATSAAIPGVTVDVAGHTLPLTSTNQREWTGTLTVPADDDLPLYGLTIHGHDRNGTYLLPFADPLPKNLADWIAAPSSDAGDMVHEVGVSPAYAWRVTLPEEGGCAYDVEQGGILCAFGNSSCFILPAEAIDMLATITVNNVPVPDEILEGLRTLQDQIFCTLADFDAAVHITIGDDQAVTYQAILNDLGIPVQNHLRFHPQDARARMLSVQIDHEDQATRTITGVYWLPARQEHPGAINLDVRWEPLPAWCDFRDPSSTIQQRWCQEIPPNLGNVFPGPVGPPEATTDTAALRWRMTTQKDPSTDRCRVRCVWGDREDAALLFEAQPARLCEQVEEQTGEVTATAEYPWQEVSRIIYTGCKIVDQKSETFHNLKLNATRKYWPIPTWIDVQEPGHCCPWYTQEEMFQPELDRWPSQAPQDIPFPTTASEGDVAIDYTCTWKEQAMSERVLVYERLWMDVSCPMVVVKGGGIQKPYFGWWQCDEVKTSITWKCGDACQYQETPGQFTPPVPALERQLTLTP